MFSVPPACGRAAAVPASGGGDREERRRRGRVAIRRTVGLLFRCQPRIALDRGAGGLEVEGGGERVADRGSSARERERRALLAEARGKAGEQDPQRLGRARRSSGQVRAEQCVDDRQPSGRRGLLAGERRRGPGELEVLRERRRLAGRPSAAADKARRRARFGREPAAGEGVVERARRRASPLGPWRRSPSARAPSRHRNSRTQGRHRRGGGGLGSPPAPARPRRRPRPPGEAVGGSESGTTASDGDLIARPSPTST